MSLNGEALDALVGTSLLMTSSKGFFGVDTGVHNIFSGCIFSICGRSLAYHCSFVARREIRSRCRSTSRSVLKAGAPLLAVLFVPICCLERDGRDWLQQPDPGPLETEHNREGVFKKKV